MTRKRNAATPPRVAPPVDPPVDPPEPDGLTRPNCATCETPLHGLYCHVCGQQHASERGIEFLTKDALAEALSLEGRTVHTLRDMFFRPGRLLNAYRIGQTDYYFSPFKLLLVVSAAFFLFVSWLDVPIYQYLPFRTGGPVSVTLIPRGVEIRGVEHQDIYLRPAAASATLPDLERALSDARSRADPEQAVAIDLYRDYNRAFTGMNSFWNDWLPRLLWLLAPFYALLLYVFFHHRRFAEHALFTIWAHCLVFAVLMIVATINLTGAALPSRILAPIYLVYFTIAAASFYGVKRWQAALLGLGHTVLYAAFIWFPVLFVISFMYGNSRVDVWRFSMAVTMVGPGHERIQFTDSNPAPVLVSSGGGKR